MFKVGDRVRIVHYFKMNLKTEILEEERPESIRTAIGSSSVFTIKKIEEDRNFNINLDSNDLRYDEFNSKELEYAIPNWKAVLKR